MRPRGARLISRRLELTNERAGTRAVRSSIATLRARAVASDEAPPNETRSEVGARQRRRGGDVMEQRSCSITGRGGSCHRKLWFSSWTETAAKPATLTQARAGTPNRFRISAPAVASRAFRVAVPRAVTKAAGETFWR